MIKALYCQGLIAFYQIPQTKDLAWDHNLKYNGCFHVTHYIQKQNQEQSQ